MVMGIVNVTTDSFYDGGKFCNVDDAVDHALKLVGEGADIIDVGGSSSRPGAELLTADEEAARVIPVIKKISKQCIDKNVLISVDTTWSTVAKCALDVGASWVNDISAGRIDPDIIDVVAKRKCTVVLTHSRKTPRDMQDDPHYDNVVNDVCDELKASIKFFKDAGVRDDKIIIDPGFGFAKTLDHNIALLRGLDKVANIGYPVLVGLSRKSMIGAITGRDVGGRLAGTLAATAVAYNNGAKIFRVHDVSETVDFLRVLKYANQKIIG